MKSKLKPRVLIFSGYGLNCEEETKFAFELAGGSADIVHINDIVDKNVDLTKYQILVFPGGFSYGDDTGSGNAFAAKIKNHIWEALVASVDSDRLVIGICNGFQILTNLGLLPGFGHSFGKKQVQLLHNDSAQYTVRWVDLTITSNSPWLTGIKTISLPIAHGEGKFFAQPSVLEKLRLKGMIAARYCEGEICKYQQLPANPNGALDDIAAITDESGLILGMMPHPERAIAFTQLPHWPYLKEKYSRENAPLPTVGPGLQLFTNAISYFA